MYGWIWRRLPFGLPGKLAGSALLVAAAVAILWFWIFPAVEPLLPFDDVQVTGDQPALPESPSDPGLDPGAAVSPGANPSAGSRSSPGAGGTPSPTAGRR